MTSHKCLPDASWLAKGQTQCQKTPLQWNCESSPLLDWPRRCWLCKLPAKCGSRGLVGQGLVRCGCLRLEWPATTTLASCTSWKQWQCPVPLSGEGELGAASWLSAHPPSAPCQQPQAQACTPEKTLNAFPNIGNNYLKFICVDCVINVLFLPSKKNWTYILQGRYANMKISIRFPIYYLKHWNNTVAKTLTHSFEICFFPLHLLYRKDLKINSKSWNIL